ncbi:MAG: CCA tRNA nucleotidyltransferase [Kiloniellaceae bacterium]
MTPAGRIPVQDWMRAPATRRVIAALTAEGAEARFVGGCVRDALAGRPVKDVDIATHLAPEEVMRLLAKAGIKTVPTGLDHGTVTAVAGRKPFEITTLRVDVETFGRRAKVAFTDDWTADAARRDFTFNALSCAPDGTLYDPFGGLEDLRAGRVRFVGDARARIEEDYLRLLRFFRFQAHYGKVPPDPAVLEIVTELAPELRRLSGERIREELFKLLRAEDPVPVVELMIERRVLQEILPVAGDAAVLRALLRAEAAQAPPDPVLRLAALMRPDAAKAEEVAERLRLSSRERVALVTLAEPETHLDPALPPRARWRAVHKLRPALYRNLLRLDWARRHAGDRALPNAALERALAEADGLASKTFPLRGRDALKLGVPAGPRLGRLLDDVEEWWAGQGFRPTRQECLDRLRALIAAE